MILLVIFLLFIINVIYAYCVRLESIEKQKNVEKQSHCIITPHKLVTFGISPFSLFHCTYVLHMLKLYIQHFVLCFFI